MLSTISTYSSASDFSLLRTYQLSYAKAASNIGGYSYITAIQECHSSSDCYPATTFTWNQPTDTNTFGTVMSGIAAGSQTNPLIRTYTLLDINGNGIQDFVWAQRESGNTNIYYSVDDAASSSNDKKLLVTLWVGDGASNTPKLIPIDYNGDGHQDLLLYNTQYNKWQLYLSTMTGAGWTLQSANISMPFTSKNIKVGDVNSDGLADVIELYDGSQSLNVYQLERVPGALATSSTYYRFSAVKSYAIQNSNGSLIDPATLTRTDTMVSLGDFNGDGKVDVVLSILAPQVSPYVPRIPYLNVYVATEGNIFRSYATIVGGGYNDGIDYVWASDINGDGLTDVVYKRASQGGGGLFYAINTGNGFSSAVSIANAKTDKSFNLVDVNHDGYADIVWQDDDLLGQAPTTQTVTYANYDTQTGVYSSYTTTAPVTYKPIFVKYWSPKDNGFLGYAYLHKTGKDGSQYSFADLNGDSWIDIAEFWGAGVTTYSAAVPANADHIATAITNALVIKPDQIVQITDGLKNQTLIQYEPLMRSSHYTPIGDIKSVGSAYENCWSGGVYQNITVSGGCTSGTAWSVNTDAFYSQVNTPFAAFSNPYVTDAPVIEATGSAPVVTVVKGSAPSVPVNSTADSAVDANALAETQYFYKRMRMQAKGRGMLGFESIATLNKQANLQAAIQVETTYRQDWPYIGMPFKTVTTALKFDASNSITSTAVLGTAENTLNTKLSGGAGAVVYQPFMASATEKSYGLKNGGASQGNLLQTITTTHSYDNFGNPLTVSVTTTGKKADGVTDTQLTKNTVNSYGAAGVADYNNIFGRLTKAVVTTTRDNEPAQTRTSSFSYYGPGTWQGLLYTSIIEPNDPNNSVTTTNTYDTHGNKIQVAVTAKGSTGAMETRNSYSAYDTNGRYLLKNWNDLNQASKVTARDDSGLATGLTDINNISTTIKYTAMGAEYLRQDATGAWKYSQTNFCTGSVCPTGARFYSTARLSGGTVVTDYFDGLGRVIRNSKIGFDGRMINVDTKYDYLGRIKYQSIPYVNASDIYWTINDYDLLGRVVQVTTPDGSVSTSQYDDYTTTIKNALGQQRVEIRNGLGQLVQVKDQLGGTIDYTYDIQGGLLEAKTTSGTQSVKVRMCYDTLGRKSAMLDPDKGGFKASVTDCALVNSSTEGWWTYQYNGFSELIKQTDPKHQSTLMTYDLLGRVKTRTDNKAGNIFESYTEWFYDTDSDAVGAQGKLTQVVMNTAAATANCTNGLSNCYRTRYEYDSFTRPVSTQVFIPGIATAFTSTIEYDFFGRPYKNLDALDQVIKNNGVAQISGSRTEYNAFGYAQNSYDLQSGKRLSQILSTNARGQITEELRGNGLKSLNDYDIKTGLLLSQSTTNPLGLINVQHNEYRWDAAGNLSYRQNLSGKIGSPVAANSAINSKGLSESFCYDSLNRLVKTNPGTTSTSGCATLTDAQKDLTYDGFGNIKSKAGSTYSYGNNAGPHAVTSTTLGDSYAYDANGNNISGAGRNFEYTSYDLVSKISNTDNSVSVAFSYGPDRSRWQRVDTKNGVVTTTTYLGNIERIQTGSTIEWKRTLEGVIYTFKTDTSNNLQASDKRYVYNDHLGSLDLITNAVGEVDGQFSQVSQSMSFDAWGARRSGETWGAFDANTLIPAGFARPLTTRGFTGHEMIDDFGIIHMNGRIYDAKLGRFLQADPHIDGAADTQGYNRYSYVHNNPLNAIDPSGFDMWSYARGILSSGLKALRPYAGMIATIAMNMYCGCGSIAAGMVGGAFGAAVNGGDVFQGALAGALGGAAGSPTQAFFIQGLVGGIQNVISGGDFIQGFVAAGIGALMGSAGFSPIGFLESAMAGGVSAQIMGGKFAGGAASAAFGYLMAAGASRMAEGGSVQHIDDIRYDKNGDPIPDDISNDVTKNPSILAHHHWHMGPNGTLIYDLTGFNSQLSPVDEDVLNNYIESARRAWADRGVVLNVSMVSSSIDADVIFINKQFVVKPGESDPAGQTVNYKEIHIDPNHINADVSAHEFGHLLGLAHQSNISQSIMSYNFSSGKWVHFGDADKLKNCYFYNQCKSP